MIIVGGGIAGVGLGHALAGRARVSLPEREKNCGRHATGRSAASLTETYGAPLIRRLAIGGLSSVGFGEQLEPDWQERQEWRVSA